MNRATSLYLDAIRFGAALTVCLGHLSGARFTGGFLWQFGLLMNDAVVIFFVLSGFVIAHAVDRRETTAAAYIVARASRICSVALPALLATFVLDAVGRSLRPDLYVASWGYVPDGRLWQFLSSLVFVNQLWWLDIRPGSDLPYWSLSYEVWYYAVFGLAVFAGGLWRAFGVLAALLLAGPRIAVLFPLWLLGLGIYRAGAAVPVPRWFAACVCAASLAGLIWLEVWLTGHRLPAGPRWLAGQSDLLRDGAIGLLFAAHLFGFSAMTRSWTTALPFAAVVRWLAGATFTIYLFHLPLAQFVASLSPGAPSSWTARITIVLGTVVGCFGAAALTERRKAQWRTAVAGLWNALRPPAAEQERVRPLPPAGAP